MSDSITSPTKMADASHHPSSSSPPMTADASLYFSWIEQFAAKHFACAVCDGFVSNPRLIALAGTTAAACASCADAKGLDSSDLPVGYLGATEDLRMFLQSHFGGKHNMSGIANTPVKGGRNAFVDANSADLESPVARRGRGQKEKEAASPTVTASVAAAHRSQLMAFMDEELFARTRILDDLTTLHLEMQRSHTARLKALRAQRNGCSKQVKMEADENYEKGNYAVAVQLYTKAISLVGDGTTRLNVLLGNRSAALFMSLDYERCVEDCLKVTQMEPTNIKLFSRAIKAAVMMGDLERAAKIHTLVDPKIVTGPMQNEYNKIAQAIDDLKEATRRHGTTEGDRMWERLMTKFSETHVFRMQLADSVAAQGMFSKAIDLLNVLVPPQRPAGVAYRIAKYRYMSGFEHFENAKATLQDYLSDQQCARLLQLIRAVDEAKQDGNNLFASRNFAASVEQYTKAIDLDLTNGKILRILYCNRAAAFKELNRFQEGVDDCTKALALDPAFGKAYARRARCLMLQKNYDAAARDFRTALQYDPNDKEIARELKNAEDAVAKEVEKEKDFFYVLDIDARTTDTEIKTKYRALCLRWHPDKNADKSEAERLVAERKFKAINEAYSTLSNPEKRREYELKKERERYAARGASGFDYMNRQSAPAGSAKYTRTRHTGAGTGYGGYTGTNNFW